MDQEHDEAISDLATVAARHPFELLGDVLEIETISLAAPCAPRLVLEPGDEVLFIGRSVSRFGHVASDSGAAAALVFLATAARAGFVAADLAPTGRRHRGPAGPPPPEPMDTRNAEGQARRQLDSHFRRQPRLLRLVPITLGLVFPIFLLHPAFVCG